MWDFISEALSSRERRPCGQHVIFEFYALTCLNRLLSHFLLHHFFLLRIKSGSAVQCPEMYCWEHNFHILSFHQLVLPLKGPCLISVTHIQRHLGSTVAHNCIDANCFLSWSIVMEVVPHPAFLPGGRESSLSWELGLPLSLPFPAQCTEAFWLPSWDCRLQQPAARLHRSQQPGWILLHLSCWFIWIILKKKSH